MMFHFLLCHSISKLPSKSGGEIMRGALRLDEGNRRLRGMGLTRAIRKGSFKRSLAGLTLTQPARGERGVGRQGAMRSNLHGRWGVV
eukprot:1916864-Pyramimonas_sp.AAC.1